MAELIWFESKDTRDVAEGLIKQMGDWGGITTVEERTSVWAGPDKVSVCRSVLHVGVPKHHPDKRFYKWQTYLSMGFRRLHTGTILPYRSRRDLAPTKKVPWVASSAAPVFADLSGDQEYQKVFQSAVRANLGFSDIGELYPAAAQMGIYKYDGMPYTLRGAYRQPDITSFIKAAYGSTRYSADLENAVAQTHPALVALTSQMRGLAENKHIVNFLAGMPDDGEDQFESSPNLRKLWLSVDTSSFKNLLTKTMDAHDTHRMSTVMFARDESLNWMVKEFAGKKIKTWQDLTTW